MKPLYEDRSLLIVNKPRDHLVYADQPGKKSVLQGLSRRMGEQKILPVHRLDFETTGCLCFAKDPKTASLLQRMFKLHEIEKVYFVFVWGFFPLEKNITLPLKNKKTKRVERAETKAVRISLFKDSQNQEISLLKVKIKTGRTHQIRRHLSLIGFPVVGDKVYGDKKKAQSGAMLLHCDELRFKHPGVRGKLISVRAGKDSDWKKFESTLHQWKLENEYEK